MADTVTITREEYDRLREAAEDLADLRAYEAAKVADEDAFPSEVVNRIVLGGEQPLLVYREWRGLSGADLSRRSGVNRIQIHDIERGRKVGSVATLKALAEALSVAIDDLV